MKANDDKKFNPYKGLEFYRESDKDIFFGRDDESSYLSQLVVNTRLTVVYGKSGIGKTSLLNAGLFPKLRDDGDLPIWIRLNYAIDTPSLLDQVKKIIWNELENRSIEIRSQVGDKQAKSLSKDETLWEYFRRVNHFEQSGDKEKMVIPVLVFDQFEDFFNIGNQKIEKNKDDLIHELYWLVEDQIPTLLKDRIQDSDEDVAGIKELLFSHARLNVHVMISLSEDYLAQLIDLKSRIPSINRTLFRVIHLNGVQARKIINMPGGIQDKDITDQILKMSETGDENQSKAILEERLIIEPFILSLICSRAIEEGIKTFAPGDRDRILTDFYDSVMKEFPEKVERFIEDKLINKEGRRIPFPLTPGMPVEKSLLQLVERRILRKGSDIYRRRLGRCPYRVAPSGWPTAPSEPKSKLKFALS